MHERPVYNICKEYTNHVFVTYSPARKSMCVVAAIDLKYLKELSSKLGNFKYLLTELNSSGVKRGTYIAVYAEYPEFKKTRIPTFET